jgi:hypothetical protein
MMNIRKEKCGSPEIIWGMSSFGSQAVSEMIVIKPPFIQTDGRGVVAILRIPDFESFHWRIA